MSLAGGKIAGTLLAPGTGSLPVAGPQSPSLPKLDGNQVAKACQLIVLQIPIKKCAEQQGVTVRAVESQRQGDSAMTLKGAANLSRSNPRAKAAFAKMFGFSGPCTDPDFMEHVQGIAEYYWRQQLQMIEPEPVVINATQFELDLTEGGK